MNEKVSAYFDGLRGKRIAVLEMCIRDRAKDTLPELNSQIEQDKQRKQELEDAGEQLSVEYITLVVELETLQKQAQTIEASFESAKQGRESAKQAVESAQSAYDIAQATYNAALRGEDQALSDYADAVDSAWRAYQTALTSLDLSLIHIFLPCTILFGLYLTIRNRGLQFTKFGYVMKNTLGKMFQKQEAGEGAVTPMQAVSTALAATVGTGNIVGTSQAIALGGYGAIFWLCLLYTSRCV